MTTVYLALGSNLGDRARNLSDAARILEKNGVIIAAKSKIYETQSVEGGGETDFLNAVLRLETELEPLELLELTQKIEAELGRSKPSRSGPRLIDLDILLWGEEKLDLPNLEVPHPRMHRRAFVLRPLLDVLEGGWTQEADEDWR